MNEIMNSSRYNFEKVMHGNSAVKHIEHVDGDIYLIERTEGRPPITVLIVDVYIMGCGAVYEIMAENEGIDAIVLVGYCNRYSSDAKKAAKDNSVALFSLSELMGALHRTGKSFISYVPRPKKDN